MTAPTHADKIATFRSLHDAGTFVMPNPHDVGTARLLETLGFPALATTSSGFAGTLGRLDMQTSLDEVVAHVEAVASAVGVPLNVDAERCFADDTDGVRATVEALGEAGASGCSIEDFDPATGAIDAREAAVERVAAAVEGAAASGLVVTARCENHIRNQPDLDDTIERLAAYRAAGADVVYAPGLVDLGEIARVVDATDAPANVLLVAGVLTVADLAEVGVRRISTGGTLARIGWAAIIEAAMALVETGEYPDGVSLGGRDLIDRAWTGGQASGA